MRSGLWTNVHAERAALVKDLTDQEDLDWATPSLCAGWDIRRPLQIRHAYDSTHIAEALGCLSRDHLFGAKSLIQGTAPRRD